MWGKTTCHSKAHNDHSDHNDHDDGRALEVTQLNIQPLQKKSQQIRWCYVGTVTWYIPLHFPTMKLFEFAASLAWQHPLQQQIRG
jgi:hypothetical protein